MPLEAVISIHLPIDTFVESLMDILDRQQTVAFFEGSQSSLLGVLLRLISQNLIISDSASFSLNRGRFHQRLLELANGVKEGEVPYTLAFHFVNIVIQEEVRLDDGTLLHNIPSEEVPQKFPLDGRIMALPPKADQHWQKHCVEAVFYRKGKPADIDHDCRIEAVDRLQRPITNAILLSGIVVKSLPHTTHVVLDSLIKYCCTHLSVGDYSFQPTPFTPDDLIKLKRTYSLLQDAEKDSILRTAIDRFIQGRKQGMQHINRVNEPNWDKVVDYIIAMETLFLTTKEGSVTQEVMYRFRLNGTSLLSLCRQIDKRKIFDALKALYKLRSRVVHGSEDTDIIKQANNFLEILRVDEPHHDHPIGRLILVSRVVEEWVTESILYLAQIPISERPYKKQGAWEDILWLR